MKTNMLLTQSELEQAAIDYVATRTKGGEIKNPVAVISQDSNKSNRGYPVYKCEVSFEE